MKTTQMLTYTMKKPSLSVKAAILAAITILANPTATLLAVDWQGASANWSVGPANPGWNAAYPNAVGAVANHGNSATSITTQDVVAGVTVGTISLTNNSNNSWTANLTNGLTLNQDSGGSGVATISNTDTTANTTNFLTISGSGNITLADDLRITNTGASTRITTGAILISSKINGSGNVTISNVLNNTGDLAGAVRLTGANTFVGSVTVAKGLMTVASSNTPFGNATNTVTIGTSGNGSASVLATSGVNVANKFVATAGSGGTLMLGATSTADVDFTGTVLLDDNLTLRSESTIGSNRLLMNGTISGVGGVLTAGAGAIEMSKVNTYTGNTTITATNTLKLTDNAELRLKIGATGVNNQINGTGVITLDGDFRFDLTTAGTTIGNSWNVITVGTLAETFGGTFLVKSTLGNFTNSGGNWTITENLVNYKFSQATGILTVAVPEPGTLVLLTLGLTVMVVRRRRS